MSWFAQVVHVARRDFRYAARLLPVYVASLAIVVAVAIGWPHLQSTTSNSNWSILVASVAVFVMATVVQQDSPSRPDAFIATQPLSWSAVVTAKIASACLLVLVPGLVAQTVVLAAYSMPAPDFIPLLAYSLGAVGESLLFAMLVAALTPGIGVFFLVLLIAVVAFASSSLVPEGLVHISGNTDDLLLNLVLLAYAILVVYQYATRDTSRARFAGILVTTAGLGVMSNGVSVTTYTNERPDLTSPSTLSIAGTDTTWTHSNGTRERSDTVWLTGVRVGADSAGSEVLLGLAASAARRGDRIGFIPSIGGLYLAHADHRHEALSEAPQLPALNDPRPPLPANVHLLGAHSDSAVLRVPLTRAQGDALLSGEATLRVDGSLLTSRAHVLATLPLRRGGRAVAPQTRIQVDSVVERKATVWMHLATIERPESNIPLASQLNDSLDFVAIHDATSEALPLEPHQESSGLLSLPMVGPEGHTTQLRLAAPPRTTWLRDANLGVVRWNLVRVDNVTFVVPPSMISRNGVP